MTGSSVARTDYSKIARRYDMRPEPVHVWVSKILEYGEIDSSCFVLDVGCGTGRIPISIQRARNPYICALEPSIDMLNQATAKEESKDILLIRGDGHELPFQDRSFDCVYMTLVIHHLENKELALLEIYRVLKADGRCVIMTSSHNRIRKSILRYFPGVTSIDLRRFPAVPSLKGKMRKIGFKDVHHHIVKHHEETIPIAEFLERVRKKHNSVLTLLGEDDFQKGFKIFKERVHRVYGTRIKRTVGFVFVVGAK